MYFPFPTRLLAHRARGTRLLLCFTLLCLAACDRETGLTVREDRAPLERRVELPAGVSRVHWLAVPAFVDSGWLEAPEKPYDLYAFIETSAAPGEALARATLVLPATVARAILPAKLNARARIEGEQAEVDGSRPIAPLTVRMPGVGVNSALEVEGGLLLHLFLSGGSVSERLQQRTSGSVIQGAKRFVRLCCASSSNARW